MKDKVQFKPGHKKFGGRKKGVKNKNKKSDQWDYFAKFCIEGGLIRFRKSLNKLNDKQYVDAFLSLLEYHKPKLQRTELTGDNKTTLQVEWLIPNTMQLEGEKELKRLEASDDHKEKMQQEYLPEIKEESPPQAIPSVEPTQAYPSKYNTVPPSKEDTDNKVDDVPPIGLNI